MHIWVGLLATDFLEKGSYVVTYFLKCRRWTNISERLTAAFLKYIFSVFTIIIEIVGLCDKITHSFSAYLY